MQDYVIIVLSIVAQGCVHGCQVSEWRQGEVDSSGTADNVVIKPLAGQGPLPPAPAVGEDDEEEDYEEGEEGEPTFVGSGLDSQGN